MCNIIAIAAYLTQTLQVDGDTLKFEFWDTAGQERYNSLAPMYYRGAHAAVVVYDISKTVQFNRFIANHQDSLVRAKKWVTELLRNAPPNIVIALVGNKLDLEEDRQVSIEEAEAYANEAGLLFTETSARTGANVNEVFLKIAKKLPKTELQLASPRIAADGRRVDLGRPGTYERTTSSRCC